jgi:hypothetical protein
MSQISKLKNNNNHDSVFFALNSRTRLEIKNLVSIYPGIYLYKNFMPQDMIETYKKHLSEMTTDEWTIYHNNYDPNDIEDRWEHGKISRDIIQDSHLHNRLFNFFTPEYVNGGKNTYFVRLMENDEVELNAGANESKNLNLNAEYIVGIYIGSWSGGEVCFPELEIKIKPEENDMLIWKSSYSHYISKVSSGIRYSYCDLLAKAPDFKVA